MLISMNMSKIEKRHYSDIRGIDWFSCQQMSDRSTGGFSRCTGSHFIVSRKIQYKNGI